VRETVLALMPLTAPPSVEAFHKQMSPLIQFAMWTYESGFPMGATEMMTPERVETWREVEHQRIAKGQSAYSKASINDYVSRLRMMGPLINPGAGWSPKAGRVKGGVSSKGLRDPYSSKDLLRLRKELLTMPGGQRKEQAAAIWAMGLGFGPQPGEMAAMTGAMVTSDADGVWVQVPGNHARRVPVAEPYAGELIAMALAAGDGKLLVIPAKHKNALGETCRTIMLGRKSAVLSPMRLRITWMLDRLHAGVDPRMVSSWAGLTSLTSVMELMRLLPEPDVTSQAALMRKDPRS
jgi:integrase